MSALRLLLVMAALHLSTATAQTVWTTAVAGMSPEEALAAVPGSVRTPSNELWGLRLGTGEDALVKIPVVVAANYEFEGLIYFLDNVLTRVRLEAEFLTQTSVGTAYEDIVRALRSKYGKEIDSDELRVPPPYEYAEASATWISSSVEIEIFYWGFGAPYKLMITYTALSGMDNL